MDLLNGLKIGKLNRFYDDRGYFQEVNTILDDYDFVQENESMSKENVIRGLHFQFPKQQAKFVRVVKGKILDVCVDLRPKSKTFLKYYKIILSNNDNNYIYIPTHFAHGFKSLENNTIVSYKCSELYQPKQQYGIVWNDKTINVDWELNNNPILSNKDANLPNLNDALNILYNTKEELCQKC